MRDWRGRLCVAPMATDGCSAHGHGHGQSKAGASVSMQVRERGAGLSGLLPREGTWRGEEAA